MDRLEGRAGGILTLTLDRAPPGHRGGRGTNQPYPTVGLHARRIEGVKKVGPTRSPGWGPSARPSVKPPRQRASPKGGRVTD